MVSFDYLTYSSTSVRFSRKSKRETMLPNVVRLYFKIDVTR